MCPVLSCLDPWWSLRFWWRRRPKPVDSGSNKATKLIRQFWSMLFDALDDHSIGPETPKRMSRCDNVGFSCTNSKHEIQMACMKFPWIIYVWHRGIAVYIVIGRFSFPFYPMSVMVTKKYFSRLCWVYIMNKFHKFCKNGLGGVFSNNIFYVFKAVWKICRYGEVVSV